MVRVAVTNGWRAKVPVLELTDVHIHYGGIEAVKGISLSVEPSEIVTMIGANGAGKTTTLKTISGLKRPTTGSIVFQGQRIDGMPAHKIVGMGIGHAPEGRRIFGRMTVRENLEMGLYAAADGKDDRGVKRQQEQEALERVYSLFPILRERAGQRGGTLSGGEQQMLAIGRALMTRQDLRDHKGDQRAGNDDPPDRAERPHGPERRPPRLCHRVRQHRPGGFLPSAPGERRGPEGLSGRGVAQGDEGVALWLLCDSAVRRAGGWMAAPETNSW